MKSSLLMRKRLKNAISLPIVIFLSLILTGTSANAQAPECNLATCGSNLVTGGDFESIPVAPIFTFPACTTKDTIVTDATPYKPTGGSLGSASPTAWTTTKDHTTGTGNFLLYQSDCGTTTGTAWTSNIPVLPNQNYVFQFYVSNPCPDPDYEPTVIVRGGVGNQVLAVIPVPYPADPVNNMWQSVCIPFSSGVLGGNLAFSIQLQGKLVTSSAIGLDDISAKAIPAQPFSVIITPDGPTTFCQDDSVTLIGSIINNFGLSFQWYNENGPITGATNSDYTTKTSGTYYLVATDANGCNAVSNSITVTVNPRPTVTLNPSTAQVCSATDLTLLTATGPSGASYQWYQKGSFNNDVEDVTARDQTTYNARGEGTFKVLATLNGCSDTDSVVITRFSQMPVIMGPSVTCPGPTAYLFLGSGDVGPGYIYQWNNAGGPIPGATNSYYNAAPGVYTVTVTYKPSNCTVTSMPHQVTPGTSPIAEAGPDKTVCPSSSVQIGTPRTPGNTYSWISSPAGFTSNLPQPVVTPSNLFTTYIVTVTNSDSCSSTDSMTVTITNPVAAINPSGTISMCEGDSRTLLANQCAGCTYQWYLNGTAASNEIAAPNGKLSALTVSAAGIYYVRVTDANGCSAVSPGTTIVVNPKPGVEIIAASIPFCQGDSLLLQGTPTTYPVYTWYKDNVNTPPLDHDYQYYAKESGNYILVVTDANGCTGQDEIMVTANDTPRAIMYSGGQPIVNNELHMCSGSGKEITAVVQNAHPGPYTYVWNHEILGVIGNNSQTHFATNAGNYWVVITNNITGCVGTSPVVKLIVDPLPPVNAGPNRTICINETTVIGTPAVPGYFYSWTADVPGSIIISPASAEATVMPKVTTTYTLTVTDISGCINTDQVTVTVIQGTPPAPPVDFTFTADKCAGVNNTFQASAIESGTFEWDMNNDGVVDISGNPVSYALPSGGYFTVGVRLRGGACNKESAFYYEIVRTIPSITGYNQGCCSEGISYNHLDVTLPSNTTTIWATSATPRTVKGTLTLFPGATLIIDQEVVEFAPYARIIVQPGARLEIKNNSILRGLASCSSMWHGIEVWGVEGAPQVSQSTPQSVQGRVFITESRIQDAHFAVLLGRLDECYSAPPSFCVTPVFVPGFGGGYITAEFAIFTNNGVSILAAPYNSPVVFSQVRNSTFTGGFMKDPSYNTGSSLAYPNPQNKYYAPANALQRSPIFVQMNQTRGFRIRSSDFFNAETAVQLLSSFIDISSTNASNTLNNNIFSDLAYGVESYNSLAVSLAFTTIGRSDFNSISKAAVLMSATRNDYITDNTFGPQAGSINLLSNPLGISMLEASNYQLINNRFRGLNTGLRIDANNKTGGLVRGYWDGNSKFTDCRTSVLIKGANPFLQVVCNTFNNSPTEAYAKTWDVSGLLANQGDPFLTARNLFPDIRKTIHSSSAFIYYHYRDHKGNTAIVTPTPSGSATLFGNGQSAPKFPCAPYVYVDPAETLDMLSDNRMKLEDIAEEIQEIQFANQTVSYLISAVQDFSVSDEILIQILQDASPLADEVLQTLLTERPVSEQSIMDIFKLNLPASAEVWHQLSARFAGFSEENRNLLENLQGTGSNNTLAKLEREADALRIERQELLNAIIEDYTKENKVSEAGNLLIVEEHPGNIQHGVAILIDGGELTTAASGIERLEADNSVDPLWIELARMHLQLKQDNRSVFQMNKEEEQLVRSIAYHTPVTEAVLNAQAILRMVYREQFSQEENVVNRANTPEPQVAIPAKELKAGAYLETAFPNPTDEQAHIKCYVPAGSGKSSLELCDLLGRVIRVYALQPGMNEVSVETQDLEAGMYLYIFRQDGKKLDEGKLSVVKP